MPQRHFWTYERDIGKNGKSAIALWSNSSKSTWKRGSFLFISTKRMHIGSFAQNAFNRCPTVLQKQFWTNKRDIGKNRKSRIVLWSSTIKSAWKIGFFFFVFTKTIKIGCFARNTFNRCPPVLQKHFWTYKKHIGKIKNQELFYGQIQSDQHEK